MHILKGLKMGSVAIVYWSKKGNTEAMARLIAQGAANNGASVTIFEAHEFSADRIGRYDAIALGCPAMHVEQLEKTTFEPMMASIDEHVAGRSIAIFGSFGWGTGEWMDKWEERMIADGADLVAVLKVNGAPTGVQQERCIALGAQLARAAAKNHLAAVGE
jgi:flavodoxin short chain